jgi:hypothetical protein
MAGKEAQNMGKYEISRDWAYRSETMDMLIQAGQGSICQKSVPGSEFHGERGSANPYGV